MTYGNLSSNDNEVVYGRFINATTFNLIELVYPSSQHHGSADLCSSICTHLATSFHVFGIDASTNLTVPYMPNMAGWKIYQFNGI